MKKQTLACIAVTALMTTASSTWATLYTYTFDGADLMSYSKDKAKSGTPADNGIYDGAMRFTSTDGTDYSSWLKSSSKDFKDIAKDSGYALAMFNLWGFGGADALGWGETFSVDSWTDSGTANKGWDSFLYSDPDDTFGKEVLAFARTEAGDALSFKAKCYPTFTFTLDLPDSTSWYEGKTGELVFWFGGYMVENATDLNADVTGILQGNMILHGHSQPVPEPATMLLFGTGLAGLVVAGRRIKKKIN